MFFCVLVFFNVFFCNVFCALYSSVFFCSYVTRSSATRSSVTCSSVTCYFVTCYSVFFCVLLFFCNVFFCKTTLANNSVPQRSYWPADNVFDARCNSVGWSLLLFVCVRVYLLNRLAVLFCTLLFISSQNQIIYNTYKIHSSMSQ